MISEIQKQKFKTGLNVAVLFSLVLLACCSQKQDVTIDNLHIYAMPPGQSNAAGYMTLSNNTDKTLVLNYVHSPIASDVEAHRVIYDQGMMQMRKVNHLTIDPGKKLFFKEGGYHLMLMGIDKPLQAGESFPLTLEFEAGYTVNAEAEVRSLGH